MARLKSLPIGMSDFAEIRQGGAIYVDKTKHIYELVKLSEEGLKPPPYFLARPRRFGKSLTLSTIKYLFEGRRELFEGLWIYERWDWENWRYPVLHMSMSSVQITKPEDVEPALMGLIRKKSKEFSIELESETSGPAFYEIIEKINKKTGKTVVVLVDEYDSPIISNLDDIEKAKKIRDLIRPFYRQLKESEPLQRFLLLTGVSKFSKAGVFSALNNLKDLTLSPQAKFLMGITEEELEEYFHEHIVALAEKKGWTYEKTKEEIRRWYNGFCFDLEGCGEGGRVYNPFSLLNLFTDLEFYNYWYASGSPKFLIDLLKAQRYRIEELENKIVRLTAIDSYEPDNLNILALLVQTGYLTIVERVDLEEVRLDYPNYEVKSGFLNELAREYMGGATADDLNSLIYEFAQEIKEGIEPERLIERFNEIYELIEYDHHLTIREKEQYYQSLTYLALALLGFKVKSEVKTRRGRIDMVLESGDKIYIIEFKVDKPAKEALEQIKRLEYAQRYRGLDKKVILLGIKIDSREGRITEWIAE